MEQTPNLKLNRYSFENPADIRKITEDNDKVDLEYGNTINNRQIYTYNGIEGLLGKPYNPSITWEELNAAMANGSTLRFGTDIENAKEHELFKVYTGAFNNMLPGYYAVDVYKDENILTAKAITEKESATYEIFQDVANNSTEGWKRLALDETSPHLYHNPITPDDIASFNNLPIGHCFVRGIFENSPSIYNGKKIVAEVSTYHFSGYIGQRVKTFTGNGSATTQKPLEVFERNYGSRGGSGVWSEWIETTSLVKKKDIVIVNPKSKMEVYRRHVRELTTCILVVISSRVVDRNYIDFFSLNTRAGKLNSFESIFPSKTDLHYFEFSAAVEKREDNRTYDIVIYALNNSGSTGNVGIMEMGLESEV